MAHSDNSVTRFEWIKMTPGERVKLHIGPQIFVFEMTDTRNLVLDMDASIVPQALRDHILRNRNIQEIVYSQDIDVSEMKVYLYTMLPYLTVRSGCSLYPKAPCAVMQPQAGDGDAYTTDGVTRIEPVFSNDQQAAIA